MPNRSIRTRTGWLLFCSPWIICGERLRTAIALAWLLFSIAGCDSGAPATASVKGKVSLDGKPLTTGRVITLPEAGRGANGLVGADGTFELSTFGERDGATLGKHKVGVVAYEGAGGGPESGEGKPLVPHRYMNPETSNLTIDVTSDGDHFVELRLTTKAEM